MELHKLDTETQVFFYEQDFYVLSNFSAFQVEFEGVVFPTSEHAYHFQRFKEHGWINTPGQVTRQMIAWDVHRARSAHDAFKIAQEKKEYQRADWDEVKVSIMEKILIAKAQQHEYVMRKLLATGDRELVEDSWRDSFWGWGGDKQGRNELGKCWMRVRDQFRLLEIAGLMADIKNSKFVKTAFLGRSIDALENGDSEVT